MRYIVIGNSSRKKRFTLIELLVVVTIIAILASLLMPALSDAKDQAKKVICMNRHRQVGVALFLYADDEGGYLPNPASDSWWNALWMKELLNRGLLPSTQHRVEGVSYGQQHYAWTAFTCPAVPQITHFSAAKGNYAINVEFTGHLDSDVYTAHRLSDTNRADEVCLVSDSASWGPNYGVITRYVHIRFDRYSGNVTNRITGLGIANFGSHGKGANLTFADGHTEYLPRDDYLQNNGQKYLWP